MYDKFFAWQEANLKELSKLDAEENRRKAWYASAREVHKADEKRLARLKLLLLQSDTERALKSLDDIDVGLLFDDK